MRGRIICNAALIGEAESLSLRPSANMRNLHLMSDLGVHSALNRVHDYLEVAMRVRAFGVALLFLLVPVLAAAQSLGVFPSRVNVGEPELTLTLTGSNLA